MNGNSLYKQRAGIPTGSALKFWDRAGLKNPQVVAALATVPNDRRRGLFSLVH